MQVILCGEVRVENNETQKTELVCNGGEKHKGHVCFLTNMGLHAEVFKLTRNPTVVCRKCGARAGKAEHVCFPEAL